MSKFDKEKIRMAALKIRYYQKPAYLTPAYIGELLKNKFLEKAAYFSLGKTKVEKEELKSFICASRIKYGEK